MMVDESLTSPTKDGLGSELGADAGEPAAAFIRPRYTAQMTGPAWPVGRFIGHQGSGPAAMFS